MRTMEANPSSELCTKRDIVPGNCNLEACRKRMDPETIDTDLCYELLFSSTPEDKGDMGGRAHRALRGLPACPEKTPLRLNTNGSVNSSDGEWALQPTSPDEGYDEGAANYLRSLSVGIATEPVMAGNQLNVTADNCPNARVAGVVFEKHYHFVSSRSSSETGDYQDIPNETQIPSGTVFARLVAYYIRQYSWIKPVNCDIRFATEDLYVGLRMHSMDRSGQMKQEEARKKKILFDPLPRTHVTPRTVLIRGDVGFGKTTLCRKIAYDWAGQAKTFPCFSKDKTVVLYLDMAALDKDVSLEDELLKLAIQKEELPTPDDPELVEAIQALVSYGRNVIVVLDGYVGIAVELKRQIKEFLEYPFSIFKEASVIVTSRPDIDNESLYLFHKNFLMKGFTSALAMRLIGKYFKHSEDAFCGHLQDAVVHFQLKGLSPLQILTMCQCKIQPALSGTLNADQMFRYLVLNVFRCGNETYKQGFSEEQVEEKIERLGSYFWKCIVNNKKVFTQDELELNLGGDLEFILASGLLKAKGPRTSDGQESWEPVHDILMETVVTFHIEKRWTYCRTTCNVASFLGSLFPRLPSLHLTCYASHEQGHTTFKVAFNFRQYRITFKISDADEWCSVGVDSSAEDEEVPNCCFCASYLIALRRRKDCEELVQNLGSLFSYNQRSIKYLSQFILPTRFGNLSLKIHGDHEIFESLAALRDNPPESQPLCLLSTVCDDLHLTFVKRACTATFLTSALQFVVGFKGTQVVLEGGLDVVELLRNESVLPDFVAAHVYSPKIVARTETDLLKNSKLCERLELFFKSDSSYELLCEEAGLL